MKTIIGNLILEKDTIIKESLTVRGSIFGKDGVKYNLIIKGDLNCRDLNCGNLNCGNLNCWDLICGDLICGNLICWNLNCWDLKAKNVSYYAVAFAYNNMEAESIKGRKENSRHFCIDGKIIIKTLNGDKK